MLIENRDFFTYLTCIRRPGQEDPRRNIAITFSMEKTRMVRYSIVKKFLRI